MSLSIIPACNAMILRLIQRFTACPMHGLIGWKKNVSSDSVDNNNPVLAYYNNRWEYSMSQENLISKSYLPKLYLVGSAWVRGSSITQQDVFGNLSTGLDYSRYNYMAGLALSYDIVNLIHRNDKTDIQHYQSESCARRCCPTKNTFGKPVKAGRYCHPGSNR